MNRPEQLARNIDLACFGASLIGLVYILARVLI